MAQGYVRNLNLSESDNTVSDRGILDNLGGLGISSDIQLFIGNSKFKSALVNDPTFTADTATTYGNFEIDKRYIITDLGTERNWSAVGASGLTVNDTFIATGSGVSGGSDGSAVEVIGRQDFFSKFVVDQGWTIFIFFGNGKIAFTEGTKVSLDKGLSYQYYVFNSDGYTRFQLKRIADDSILDLTDVSDMTITRSDEITAENIRNYYVDRALNVDNIVQSSNTASDPFEKINEIAENLQGFPSKRRNVIRTYVPDDFSGIGTEGGLVFTGATRITNKGDGTDVITIGSNTSMGDLIVGETYRIVDLGNNLLSHWLAIGANDIIPGAREDTSGSFIPGTVYRITTVGKANLGANNDGVFSFSKNDVNPGETFETIEVGSSHGIVVDDVVVFNSISQVTEDLIGLTNGVTYYVHTAGSSTIKLKASPGVGDPINLSVNNTGETDPAEDIYSITVDPQKRWNAIAGTSGVIYAPDGNMFFEAQNDGATITGGKAKLVDFVALEKGSAGTGELKPLEAPGLYILNPVDGRAVRAFTSKDNPWEKKTAYGIDVDGDTTNDFTIDTLQTTTAVQKAQSQNYVHEVKNDTSWGSFVVGEKYTVTDTGTSRDWRDVGHTVEVPSIGSSFVCDNVGPSGGSGGFAKPSPKLIFHTQITNTQSRYNPTAVVTENITVADYTHTIPVYVNGEVYYLLAYLPPTTWGNFNIGEQYTVLDRGSSRNWTLVGHQDVTPAIGSTFVASNQGPSGGSGGSATGSKGDFKTLIL